VPQANIAVGVVDGVDRVDSNSKKLASCDCTSSIELIQPAINLWDSDYINRLSLLMESLKMSG
jgi:hypothetical protein